MPDVGENWLKLIKGKNIKNKLIFELYKKRSWKDKKISCQTLQRGSCRREKNYKRDMEKIS